MTSLLDQQDTSGSDQTPNKDYLSELTGPGAKFDRSKYGSETEMYQAIARGKVESDTHISSLTKDQNELRAEYARVADEARAQARLQELIDRLETPRENNTNSGSDNQNAAEQTEKPSFNPKDIEDIVSRKISETKQREVENSNLRTVQDKLKDSYGDNYPNYLKEQMHTLGLSQEDIDNLAKKSPNAFFNVIGLNNKSESFQSPPRSTQSAAPFGSSPKRRDERYYNNLRDTNPKEYFSPKIKVQMHKDAQELGEAFFNG